MATAAQIRERALRKLGINAAGQTTQAEVREDLDQAYQEVHAMLSTKNIAPWDFDEDIPDEFAEPVVFLVADSRKDDYAIPNDRYQRITLGAIGDGSPNNPGAEAKIRIMQASNAYKTPPAEYY